MSTFETKTLANDLTRVNRMMQAGLFVSGSESMRDAAAPRDDEKQRQRIVARHIAACAEHQRYLAELEEAEKSCNG